VFGTCQAVQKVLARTGQCAETQKISSSGGDFLTDMEKLQAPMAHVHWLKIEGLLLR